MDERPILDSDARIFTIRDVYALILRHKKELLKAALIGACLFCGYFSLKTTQYKIEATFKEGEEEGSGGGAFLQGLVGGNAAQPKVIALMNSFQVLKPLVEKMGLAAHVEAPNWMLRKVYRRLKDNYLAERGRPLPDLDPFLFSDVLYEGEEGLLFHVRFDDECHFSVFQERKGVATGEIGSPVVLAQASFTIQKIPQSVKFGRLYSMSISPWISAAREIRSRLKITVNKSSKFIYDLALIYPNRRLGRSILNRLMVEYRDYLKRDYDEMAKEQISYLDEKQEEIYRKLAELYDVHATYLQRCIQTKGYMGLDTQAEIEMRAYQGIAQQLLPIEVEMEHLAKVVSEGKMITAVDGGPFAKMMQETLKKIQELKLQRDLLGLHAFRRQPSQQTQLETRRADLNSVRERKGAAEKLLQSMDAGSSLDFDFHFDAEKALAEWAKHLDPTNVEEREDLAEYLENYVHLLSMQEKMLHERFFHSGRPENEFDGIDLEGARMLYATYQGKLDEAQSALLNLDKIQKEIGRSDFEMASLAPLLVDPLSQSLIAEASKLILQLKDEKHHSPKEGERWETEVALQKKILSGHLRSLSEVEELKSALYREKIEELRSVSLDCINQQISVLSEKITNSVSDRRASLAFEKGLLEKKMDEMKEQNKDLPDRWRFEKWLKLKSDMALNLMRTITELSETKVVSHRLHRIESKPLDCAALPLIPMSPRLFWMTLLGAFVSSFGLFFFHLSRSISGGFPISPERLKVMGFPYLGEIGLSCDGPQVEKIETPDLETLRRVTLFLEKTPSARTIGLIAGQGPDYSSALAENLARMSRKSVILRCDFGAKFQDSDLPGILQLYNRETSSLPLRKENGFDFMTSGGYTLHGAEILQSKVFDQILEELKEKYDFVFLLVRSSLDSAESAVVLRHSDKAVVTVCSEPIDQLTQFAHWAYDAKSCRLQFIAAHPRG
jgi:hypothetical protein